MALPGAEMLRWRGGLRGPRRGLGKHTFASHPACPCRSPGLRLLSALPTCAAPRERPVRPGSQTQHTCAASAQAKTLRVASPRMPFTPPLVTARSQGQPLSWLHPQSLPVTAREVSYTERRRAHGHPRVRLRPPAPRPLGVSPVHSLLPCHPVWSLGTCQDSLGDQPLPSPNSDGAGLRASGLKNRFQQMFLFNLFYVVFKNTAEDEHCCK